MTTIDDIGRQAAAELRSQMSARIDADAGFDRIVNDQNRPGGLASRRRTARSWLALVPVAAAVLAVVWVATRSDQRRTITNSPTTDVPATVSAEVPESTAVPITVAVPTTDAGIDEAAVTTATVTSDVSPTSAPEPARPIASVSYTSPPPVFEPTVFASAQLTPPPDGGLARGAVAVTSSGVVVVDPVEKTAVVVDWFGLAVRTIPLLDAVPWSIVAGPADVLYGVGHTNPSGTEIVAIPLTGDQAGRVVARAATNGGNYNEAPLVAIARGPSGIVGRVPGGQAEMMAYVDPSGQPLADYEGAQVAVLDPDDTVHLNGLQWHLGIERDPASPAWDGRALPAPSGNGGAVYWTEIGPPADPTADVHVPTMPVIAALNRDGSAQWWSLPDGWSVVASDEWGTILGHATDGAFELARFPDSAAPTSGSPVRATFEVEGVTLTITLPEGAIPDPRPGLSPLVWAPVSSRWIVPGCGCNLIFVVQTFNPPRYAPDIVDTFDSGGMTWNVYDSSHEGMSYIAAADTADGLAIHVGTNGGSLEAVRAMAKSVTRSGARDAPLWKGRVDVDMTTGAISAEGFNTYVDTRQPVEARTAEGTARMLVGPSGDPETTAEVSEQPGTDGRTIVTVTMAHLLDDSVSAVRYQFELEQQMPGDTLFRFVSGEWSQQCQPGRGHQDFTTELCI